MVIKIDNDEVNEYHKLNKWYQEQIRKLEKEFRDKYPDKIKRYEELKRSISMDT